MIVRVFMLSLVVECGPWTDAAYEHGACPHDARTLYARMRYDGETP